MSSVNDSAYPSTSATSTISPLVALPDELVLRIADFVDARDLLGFSQTCHRLNEISGIQLKSRQTRILLIAGKMADQIEDSQKQDELLGKIASLLAMYHWKSVEEVANMMQSPQSQVSTLCAAAKEEAQEGIFYGSQLTLESATAAIEKIGPRHHKVGYLVKIVELQAKSGDIEAAKKTLKKADPFFKEIKNAINRDDALQNICKAKAVIAKEEAKRGKLEDAKETLRAAEVVAQEMNKGNFRRYDAFEFIFLALIYVLEKESEKGDIASAKMTFKIVEKIADEIDKDEDYHSTCEGIFSALLVIAKEEAKRGDVADVQRTLEKAILRIDKLGSPDAQWRALIEITKVQIKFNDLKNAKETLEKAKQVLERVKKDHETLVEFNKNGSIHEKLVLIVSVLLGIAKKEAENSDKQESARTLGAARAVVANMNSTYWQDAIRSILVDIAIQEFELVLLEDSKEGRAVKGVATPYELSRELYRVLKKQISLGDFCRVEEYLKVLKKLPSIIKDEKKKSLAESYIDRIEKKLSRPLKDAREVYKEFKSELNRIEFPFDVSEESFLKEDGKKTLEAIKSLTPPRVTELEETQIRYIRSLFLAIAAKIEAKRGDFDAANKTLKDANNTFEKVSLTSREKSLVLRLIALAELVIYGEEKALSRVSEMDDPKIAAETLVEIAETLPTLITILP